MHVASDHAVRDNSTVHAASLQTAGCPRALHESEQRCNEPRVWRRFAGVQGGANRRPFPTRSGLAGGSRSSLADAQAPLRAAELTGKQAPGPGRPNRAQTVGARALAPGPSHQLEQPASGRPSGVRWSHLPIATNSPQPCPRRQNRSPDATAARSRAVARAGMVGSGGATGADADGSCGLGSGAPGAPPMPAGDAAAAAGAAALKQEDQGLARPDAAAATAEWQTALGAKAPAFAAVPDAPPAGLAAAHQAHLQQQVQQEAPQAQQQLHAGAALVDAGGHSFQQREVLATGDPWQHAGVHPGPDAEFELGELACAPCGVLWRGCKATLASVPVPKALARPCCSGAALRSRRRAAPPPAQARAAGRGPWHECTEVGPVPLQMLRLLRAGHRCGCIQWQVEAQR